MNNIILMALSTLMSYAQISENEWHLSNQREVMVDSKEAILLRYVKSHNDKLYGEHFSSLFAKDGKLLGFVRLEYSNNNDLVSEEEAKSISDKFLTSFAPDLLENRSVLWIKPHDETLLIDNQPMLVRGMKVKSLNEKTGLYFWNIINGDGKVFVFERDIEWLNLEGKRGTEKWLHDEWLDGKLL